MDEALLRQMATVGGCGYHDVSQPAGARALLDDMVGAIGLPLEAVGLILAVDRVLDMCRTSVNIFSDSCGAVIIGRMEGEKGILQKP